MLEQRAVPSTIDWIGGAHSAFNVTTGDPAAWSNPFNWIGQVAPGPNDTAVFDANTSISFSDGLGDTQTFTATTSSTVDLSFPTIGGVSLDSNWPGTLTVNASLGLTGNSEWDNGTISIGTGSLSNSGTMTLNNTSGVTLNGGGTLTNSGTMSTIRGHSARRPAPASPPSAQARAPSTWRSTTAARST